MDQAEISVEAIVMWLAAANMLELVRVQKMLADRGIAFQIAPALLIQETE